MRGVDAGRVPQESPQRAVRQTPVNRSMSGPLPLVGALLLLAPISCVTVFAQDFGQAGDLWRIWVSEVRTGADNYYTGREVWDLDHHCYWLKPGELIEPSSLGSHYCPEFYQPPAGLQHLHVVLAIRNLGTEPRTFDLTAVRLGGGEIETTPSIFDMNWLINWEAKPHPKLDSGEEIARMLIFNFPENLDPDRLTAGGLILTFPDSRK